jgi:hypothetical protein
LRAMLNRFNEKEVQRRLRRSDRPSIGVVNLILLLILTTTFSRPALAQEPNEHFVKAAFLFNFVKFIEWPAQAFNNSDAPIIVGVLGDDPSCSAIDQTINGKTANGRRLAIRRFPNATSLTYCHLLFIGYSQKNNLEKILAAAGPGVLTIGETDRFTRAGGIINFAIVDSKVRFEINQAAAEKAGLKISAKLLGLSRPVSK